VASGPLTNPAFYSRDVKTFVQDDGLSIFAACGRVVGIAYRMLGALLSEDVVQDIWCDGSPESEHGREPPAYLATATIDSA